MSSPLLSSLTAVLISAALAMGGGLPADDGGSSFKADSSSEGSGRVEHESLFVVRCAEALQRGYWLVDVPVVSGNEVLDAYLDLILDCVVGHGDNALRNAYEWIGNNRLFPYIEMDDVDPGEPWTAWSVDCAIQMAAMGEGNCYRYAALMCWVARALGYDARAVSGYVLTNSGWNAHGWVEVVIDGETYILDPQQHSGSWSAGRDYFLVTYDEAPLFYNKSGDLTF